MLRYGARCREQSSDKEHRSSLKRSLRIRRTYFNASVLSLLGPPVFEMYIEHWPKLLEALIGLFELPQDETIGADEHFIDVEDTPGSKTCHIQGPIV